MLAQTKSHRDLGLGRMRDPQMYAMEENMLAPRNSLGAPQMAGKDARELFQGGMGVHAATYDSRSSMEFEPTQFRRVTPQDQSGQPAESQDYASGMTPQMRRNSNEAAGGVFRQGRAGGSDRLLQREHEKS